MNIPPELITKLEFLCEANEYGMLLIQGEEHTAIIMGHRKWSPDQMSLIVAYNLLRGVISSELNEMNDAEQERREKERKM